MFASEAKPITLHFSEPLVRRAIKAFWWRNTGWSFVLAAGLMAAGFGWMVWSGNRSWKVGLVGTILVGSIAAAASLYFVHYRAAFARFRRMRTPEAILKLGEDRFRVTSDMGTSEMAWSIFTALWCFPDFWLLFFSRAQFVTLPAADLDLAAREFIVAKLEAHGVKIA